MPGVQLKKLVIPFLILFSSIIPAKGFKSHSQEHYSNTADKIISTALADTVGFNLARYLCKNIGPRLSGSENSMKAIKWAENILNKMDLDRVWLQPVMVPHWIRGDVESAEIIDSKFNKNLNISAYGRSIATPKEGITAKVLEVNDFDELSRKKDEAKGKIIFYNYHYNHSFIETFQGYSDAIACRVAGAIEGAKVGAVGSIVRSITTKYDNVTHVGVMRAYPDTVVKIPSAAIGLMDADYLSRSLKEDPDLKVNFKLSAQTLPDVQSYNVIGEIKGSEKPEDVIVLGAHFDSWDKGDGAHDDGAPSMQVLEVLDLFKRLEIKPKRTIRCVLFINEENGLRGGRAYAGYVDSAKENTIAAIESDRGAFTPRGFYVDADSSLVEGMQNWLPILKKSLIDWIKPGHSGADIGRIKGAKALMAYVPDGQRYFDYHHSDNDVFEAVSPREMELGTAAIAIMAYLISEEGL